MPLRLRDSSHAADFVGFAADGVAVEKALHESYLSTNEDKPAAMTPACTPCHTNGVLVDYRDNGRGSVAAACRECFEVGLQAGASAGVAACDSEGATICFLVHIFHFSRFHALSQNSHSIFVHSTKISVMAAFVSGEAACASS